MTKTWVEKRETDKVYQVKVNPKKFSDIPLQTKMLIPTSRINKDDRQITSFWRAVEPDSKLAQKLTCGLDFIIQRQSQEGITF